MQDSGVGLPPSIFSNTVVVFVFNISRSLTFVLGHILPMFAFWAPNDPSVKRTHQGEAEKSLATREKKNIFHNSQGAEKKKRERPINNVTTEFFQEIIEFFRVFLLLGVSHY